MRWNGVPRCARLVVVSLALCLLTAVPALGSESTTTSAGSGFVITADGYILTNEHVVGDSKTVNVFVDGIAYPAATVTKSVESDLALLKIAATGLTPVALGNSLSVQLLDDVVALGYPLPQFGRDLTVSEGRITSFRTNVGGREGRDTLQHDAVITHGSSGGPLFSLKGEVIGVNFAGVEGSGMQLAIPINEAVPLLRSIPSFSPSGMGRATQMLAAQDIVAAYMESVVYIEVATAINWQSVLPTPNAVSGWPDEEAYDPSSWEQWLTSLGFPVAGVAGLSSPSPKGGGFYNAVVMVAFPEAQSAQSALDLLLHQEPPIAVGPEPLFTCEGSSPVLIGEGVDNPGSTGARWELWFNVCRNTANLPVLGPRPGSWSVSLFAKLVVAQRNLAFRINVGWRGEYGDYDTNSRPYSFQDGYLLLGGERYLSGDELLRRLEQLSELVIVTVTNKLAGQ